MDIRLYTLRLRQGMKGVVAGFVEVPAGDAAVERAEAERKGRWYCDQEPGRRYIGVESAILVRLDQGPQPVAKAEPKADESTGKKAKAS